jgi:hypothetical protein
MAEGLKQLLENDARRLNESSGQRSPRQRHKPRAKTVIALHASLEETLSLESGGQAKESRLGKLEALAELKQAESFLVAERVENGHCTS